MLTFEKDGLWAGHVNIWGDWAAHISYVSSLAIQPFFPPQFPILAGHPLSYPFAMDFISAILVRIGFGLIPAMLVPSLALSIILVAVIFFFYKNLLENTKAATLAVFLFLLNGGLGFLWFLDDLKENGLAIILKLPREYTLLRGEPNIEWINIIVSELIPQRGFLLGLPISIFALVVLWKAYTKGLERRQLLLAGAATGLLPIIHMHSFFVILAVSFWTFILCLRRQKARDWLLLYFLPTVLLSVTIFITFYPQFSASHLKFQFGWLAGQAGDNTLFFWIKNAGVMLFLPLAGLLLSRRKLVIWSVPFWALFLLANLFIFQPYPWDNTKFFTYWWLLAAGFAALFLQSLLTKWPLKVLALLLFFLATFSGSLDVLRLTQYENLKIRMLSRQDLEVSSWAKNNTPKEAIFLTADNHDNPITMLSGRRVVLGFRGWLWTYGVDTTARAQAVEDIYRGKDAEELLTELNVDYVVISEVERSRYESLDEGFFAENFPLVYSERTTQVYKNNYGLGK